MAEQQSHYGHVPAEILETTPDTATFVMTTPAVDRDGDVVDPDGIDLKAWEAAGAPVMFGHGAAMLPIGTCVDPDTGRLDVWREKEKWLARVHFDMADSFSAHVAHKVNIKILRGASVAFVPGQVARRKDGQGHYFKTCQLTELSIVVVPSNQEAVMRGLLAGASPVVEKKLRQVCRGGVCRPAPQRDPGVRSTPAPAPKKIDWGAVGEFMRMTTHATGRTPSCTEAIKALGEAAYSVRKQATQADVEHGTVAGETDRLRYHHCDCNDKTNCQCGGHKMRKAEVHGDDRDEGQEAPLKITKGSARMLATLHKHVSQIPEWLGKSLPSMDNEGVAGDLQAIAEKHCGPMMEAIERCLRKHHPDLADHSMEDIHKAMSEGSGPAGGYSVAPGEEGMVDNGDIPEEGEEYGKDFDTDEIEDRYEDDEEDAGMPEQQASMRRGRKSYRGRGGLSPEFISILNERLGRMERAARQGGIVK